MLLLFCLESNIMNLLIGVYMTLKEFIIETIKLIILTALMIYCIHYGIPFHF